MIHLTQETNNIKVELKALTVGNDLNVTICGGDQPHIGAVAVALPRASLLDENQRSASTSVITVPGHKEDLIAHRAAGQITTATGHVTTVTCGVHLDDASLPQIQQIDQMIGQLTTELIERITRQN
ncbi:hypothetical protein [Vibrio quintilis]|uniref:Prenylated flavin chaperone LpdD-like domain-containing protein n=1 Tax=Vibrio quintilis TaxID=1117707 RepID=A0A1M7Z087_9VIBR|nr:hypothetical protein [Vibrio quintilis]SHO58233.1 hypothetical protein VQ7734_04003 [Vibrio quintilis]